MDSSYNEKIVIHILLIFEEEMCIRDSRQHSFSTPVLKIGGSRALIYNLGGNSFQIESRSKTILKKDGLSHNILAGDISQSGEFAIVTESEGYFSELTVYDKNTQAIDSEDYRYRYYLSLIHI